MDDIRIIATTEAHAAGFNAAVGIVARERRYIGLVDAPPLQASLEFIRSVRAAGGVHLVAVSAGGEIVGWCDIARNDREGFRHGGRLGVGLLPAYRGAGLGRRLMLAAIEEAWRSGFERIELDVFASNTRAITLYETLGFEREGIRRRARKLDGQYDDDIIMARLAPVSPNE